MADPKPVESYQEVIQGCIARLVEAIDTATGNNPQVFANHLISNNFTSLQGTNSIVLVPAFPPYEKISRLMGIVLNRIKTTDNFEKAKKLFNDFLSILREMGVNDLPEEMKKKAQPLNIN